jgi:hypothetical protein
MQDNDLNSLILSAKQSNSLSEVNDLLLKAKSYLKSSKSSEMLTIDSLNSLKTLLDTYKYQQALTLGKLYKSLLQYFPKTNKPVLIALCKDVKSLTEVIHGTDLSYILRSMLQQESHHMLLDPSLSNQDQSFFRNLLNSSQIEFPETLLDGIISDLKENNPFGLSRLMDCFCSMNSIQDQFFYFSTLMQPIVLVLEQNMESDEEIDREILLKLLELLEHFVFKYNFNVQLSKYDPNSPMYAQAYTVSEFKLVKNYKQNFDIFISMISILQVGDILITQNLARVIHRLWNLFRDNRALLYDLIFHNLKEIASGGTEEAKKSGIFLLSDVMNSKETSPDFKSKLENERILTVLLNQEENEEIFELGEETEMESLQINVGFPLASVIPSGGAWSHLVEVPESRCLLTFGFATESYDLSFSLLRVDLPEPEVLISQHKVKCDDNPFAGIRLLTSPGLYLFTWSNSYSWFRAKHLRYKIYVLRPYKKSFTAINTDLSKAINIVADDDIGDSVFTEDLDFLEVGVQVKQKTIRMICLNPNGDGNYICEEAQFENESEIVLALSDFIGDVLKDATPDKRFASIKVGFVMDHIRMIPGIEELSSVAVARDIYAIAFLSQDSLHSHTIIVVMNEDGIRSCVLFKGRILFDDSGQCVGNIALLPEMELHSKIAVLLCMFGPAAVILAGEEFKGNLSVLSGKIKPWVPADIWKKSFIRESVFKQAAAAQAAAKLHYLNFKFNYFI